MGLLEIWEVLIHIPLDGGGEKDLALAISNAFAGLKDLHELENLYINISKILLGGLMLERRKEN